MLHLYMSFTSIEKFNCSLSTVTDHNEQHKWSIRWLLFARWKGFYDVLPSFKCPLVFNNWISLDFVLMDLQLKLGVLSLDCTHILSMIWKRWVKPHSDSTESAVWLSYEEHNYIHLGIDGSVWTEHECTYFTVPPQRPGQVLCPWLCLQLPLEIETGISKCFLYPCQIALMTCIFFHVFSLPASRVVLGSSLNMVVLERNPWPLTLLQSL